MASGALPHLRSTMCRHCLVALRGPSSVLAPRSIGLQNSDRQQRRYKGVIAPEGGQAMPLVGFYAELLTTPTISHRARQVRQTRPSSPNQATPEEKKKLPTAEPPDSPPDHRSKAKIVFGSRLASPVERAAAIAKASTNVAGVTVPPRPEEPDNCCMSGCVNCVWDVYREDMEEFRDARVEARKRILHRGEQVPEEVAKLIGLKEGDLTKAVERARNMRGKGKMTDQDKEWIDQDIVDDGVEPAVEDSSDLFADIPVGIREFMKTEKRLKEIHAREAAQDARQNASAPA